MFDAILFFTGVIGGAGAYIFHYSYSSSREVIGRKLGKLPKSSIAAIRDGELVRIVGTVVAIEPAVMGPISGEPCVHYQAIVERKGFLGWSTIVDESRGVPFLLEDETGRVHVEAGRAMLTTKHLRYIPYGHGMHLAQFLRAHHVPAGEIRVREMLIEAGDTFAILGAGVADVDPDAEAREGYRADRATRLSFAGGKNHPLVISDDPALR